jgi:uncharacterized protein (TIGR04551 family)
VHRGGFRIELEVATVIGVIGDASEQPGVALRERVLSRQFGGVLSSSYQFRWPIRLRVELGVASGDDAPGFGNRPERGPLVPAPGDVDGPQFRPPVDYTVDNFRFNPDYRFDLVLWRRILGQMTDAVYVKPSVRLGPFGSTHHHVTIDAALVDSNALYRTTPPGQERHLGVELDVVARYRYEHGFEALLGYGVLFPGAGFRNVVQNLDPRPAQVLELILAYRM